MTFSDYHGTTEAGFKKPEPHATHNIGAQQPSPASSPFDFEHMDPLAHLQRIESMQVAHQAERRQAEEAQRVAKEEQERLQLELGLEDTFAEDETAHVEGTGEEEQTNDNEHVHSLILDAPHVEQDDTNMTDRDPPNHSEFLTQAAECFVNAPPPGSNDLEAGYSMVFGHDMKVAAEALDRISLEDRRATALVTSYSDGFVTLALIAATDEGLGQNTCSPASLLFNDGIEPVLANVKTENADAAPTLIKRETTSPSSTGHLDDTMPGFTGAYVGRRKVRELLRSLTFAQAPIAIMSTATPENSTLVCIIGKQKHSPAIDGSNPEPAQVDVTAELSDLQQEARHAFLEHGGDMDAYDSEFRDVRAEYGHEDIKFEEGEAPQPQNAARGNKPTSLAAMAEQTAAATPKRKNGGRSRSGGTVTGKRKEAGRGVRGRVGKSPVPSSSRARVRAGQ